ncbi:MAG: cation:proton antiporter, partial [Solirubrobacterales bacterium]|nr:cation:proton antiporter [Solirubrobacterales bacterium]
TLSVAIVLVATSLGVIIPVLKDSGNISSSFGQLVIAAASIADLGAIILLSLFLSGNGSTSTAGALILLGIFGTVAAVSVVISPALGLVPLRRGEPRAAGRNVASLDREASRVLRGLTERAQRGPQPWVSPRTQRAGVVRLGSRAVPPRPRASVAARCRLSRGRHVLEMLPPALDALRRIGDPARPSAACATTARRGFDLSPDDGPPVRSIASDIDA